MKRVVIVGAGFAGLQAMRALARQSVEVLLIDRRNYHLFQPLLYQVATAGLQTDEIAYPARALVRRWPNTHFQLAEVCGVDLAQRQLLLAHGAPVPYDYLVLSAGSVTNYYGLEGVQRLALDLKQLGDAVVLRNRVLCAFERACQARDPAERAALMTFVIVGGGPTGIEFAGALSELVRHVLTRDYRELDVHKTRIILLEALPQLLSPFAPKLQQYALSRLQHLGVEVRLNTAVSDAQRGRVLLKDGSEIATHTLFWAAGVRAAPLADALQVARGRGGRIVVRPDLALPDHPEVFVVGDMAYLEQDGAPLPMLAPVAMQQGRYVGRAIIQRERGQPLPPFRYRDKGAMAIIGRNSAIARWRGLQFSGFLAWLAWLGLHLYYLVGFRNQLLAIIDWGYQYIMFDRKVRLITGEGKDGCTGDTL